MIELQNISKTFESADGAVEALRDVSLTIRDGDIYGVIGMSGAGKSTLVRCINLLERPSSGTVLIDGRDIAALRETELRKVRRKISMVFQGFNLLSQRTCLDNICFPLALAGVKKRDALVRARELLSLVGLSDKADAYPSAARGSRAGRSSASRSRGRSLPIRRCCSATRRPAHWTPRRRRTSFPY